MCADWLLAVRQWCLWVARFVGLLVEFLEGDESCGARWMFDRVVDLCFVGLAIACFGLGVLLGVAGQLCGQVWTGAGRLSQI